MGNKTFSARVKSKVIRGIQIFYRNMVINHAPDHDYSGKWYLIITAEGNGRTYFKTVADHELDERALKNVVDILLDDVAVLCADGSKS